MANDILTREMPESVVVSHFGDTGYTDIDGWDQEFAEMIAAASSDGFDVDGEEAYAAWECEEAPLVLDLGGQGVYETSCGLELLVRDGDGNYLQRVGRAEDEMQDLEIDEEVLETSLKQRVKESTNGKSLSPLRQKCLDFLLGLDTEGCLHNWRHYAEALWLYGLEEGRYADPLLKRLMAE